MIKIEDLIKALINHGIQSDNNGIVVHYHCNYCGSHGWEGPTTSKEFIHKKGCFVQLATEWLKQNETETTKESVFEAP